MPFSVQLSFNQLSALFAIGALVSLFCPLVLELDQIQVILSVITSAGLSTASLLWFDYADTTSD